MKLSYGLTIEQTQKLTMTPELIQAIRILQFNTQELDSFVQEELLENPVLELDGKKKEDTSIDIQERLKEDYDDEDSYRQWERSSDREEYSYEQFVSKEETLEDFQLQQQKIPAAVIGFLSADNDRVIVNGEERRFLEPANTDAIYRME